MANIDLNKPICDLPEDYKPSDHEDFMNPKQLEYFRRKLIDWKQDLSEELNSLLKTLKEDSQKDSDITDMASNELDLTFELRSKDRVRKLLSKIEEALIRIKNGTYGYCEKTGEPIAIKRLEARPIATMSIEAQEIHEKLEKMHKLD